MTQACVALMSLASKMQMCADGAGHLEQPDLAGGDCLGRQAQALQSDLDGGPVLRARSADAGRGRQPRRQQLQRVPPQLLRMRLPA